MNRKFSKGEAIRFSWQAVKSRLGFFLVIMLAAGLVYLPSAFLAYFLEKTNPIPALIFNLLSVILSFIIQLGLIRVSLKFCDSQKVKFSDLFSSIPVFFKFILSSVLCSLAILGGFILLIIPGIILGIRMQFYGYLIVEKGLGPLQALNESFKMTKGCTWQLCLLSVLLMLINLLGALALFVGLLVTIPISVLAKTHVYRSLIGPSVIKETKTLAESRE